MHKNRSEIRELLKNALLHNVLLDNPVLTAALGICTIVAAATTLQNGWVLSQMFALITIPVCVISAAFYHLLPRFLRTPAVAVTAAVCYTLAIFVLQNYYGTLSTLFRYYLPLMAVNSLMFSRAVRFAPRQPVWVSAVDSAACVLGFGAVACLVGGIRELFAAGTLGGVQILNLPGTLYMANVPFFGFLVLGFVAAGARALTLRQEKKAARAARRKGGEHNP